MSGLINRTGETAPPPPEPTEELKLVRGWKADGTNPTYAAAEFIPYFDFRKRAGEVDDFRVENPAALARNANHRAHYDASLFREIGLSDVEVSEVGRNGVFLAADQPVIIRDPPNPNVTISRVKVIHEWLVTHGLEPLVCLWGNPTTITTFFPKVLVRDYNTPYEEVRRGVFRIEGAAFWHNPSLELNKHRIMLYELAGVDIRTAIPFNWDAVAAQGGIDPRD